MRDSQEDMPYYLNAVCLVAGQAGCAKYTEIGRVTEGSLEPAYFRDSDSGLTRGVD